MKIQNIPGGVCAPAGFKASGVHCGVRRNHTRKDLAMVVSDVPCSAAAVYTQNKVAGAPILVTRANIADGRGQGLVCNSGNANTCNPNGIEIAEGCCRLAAEATGLSPQDFLIASTGVIGQPMELSIFESGIPKAAASLASDGSQSAAEAIMTTDTVRKEYAAEFELDGKTCRVGLICKGSGMIHINMATMLAFVTTDVAISPAALQAALSEVTVSTFNQVSIDGDSSTNDMASVLANGMAGNTLIEDTASPLYKPFAEALHHVLRDASRALAGDGEGATKLLECHVQGAPSDVIARSVAKAIIASNLFKAAMFGDDANWGRILCAIGNDPSAFSAENISVVLSSRAGSIHVCEHSAYHPFSEDDAAIVLAEKDITVRVNLNDGEGQGTAWGCDLTYDYVKINGDYRT